MTPHLKQVVAQLLTEAPFGLTQGEKEARLLPALDELTREHYARCAEFRRVVEVVFGGLSTLPYATMAELPFIPVSLFKRFELRSVPPEETFRVLTSSGTTGQAVSRVVLDRDTATHQAHALVRIMQQFVGKQRLPMVILDHPGVIKDRASFSARGAGILGMMQFGRQPLYAFREDMSFDFEGVGKYLAAHAGQPVLFFGFTFMAWEHGVRALRERNLRLNAANGVLIHSGGWKKLEAARVDAATFATGARETLGVGQVINFYGMVEQVGSVFFENKLGALQAPVFADVIVRDPFTLKPLPAGQRGLVQVISILPHSYPGHSLLTEDLGEWIATDQPETGLGGRSFLVHGRAPRSEIRGCSETYVQPE
ncbi:MAG: hypothetical protein Q8M02_07755 [Candidatus Didemnitutus sp.]|nr:hypothetical protein [Candidatus Didemnitutus sp.]